MGSSQHPASKVSAAALSPLPSMADRHSEDASMNDYMPKPNADGFILPVRQRIAPLPRSDFFNRPSSVIDLTMDSESDDQDNDKQSHSPQQLILELDDEMSEENQNQEAKQRDEDAQQHRVSPNNSRLQLMDQDMDRGGLELLRNDDDHFWGRELMLHRDESDNDGDSVGGRGLEFLQDDDLGGRQLDFLRDNDTVMREATEDEDNNEDEENDELLSDMSSVTENDLIDATNTTMKPSDVQTTGNTEDKYSVGSPQSPVLKNLIKDEEQEEIDELRSMSPTPEPSELQKNIQVQPIAQCRDYSSPAELLLGQGTKENAHRAESPIALQPQRISSQLIPNQKNGFLKQNGNHAADSAANGGHFDTHDVCSTSLPGSPEKAAMLASKTMINDDGSVDSFLGCEAVTELSDPDPALLGSPVDLPPPCRNQESSIAVSMPHSTTVLPRLVQSKLRYSLLKTGYVYDISMYFHQQLATLFDRDDPHPESPHRIYVIYKELKRDGYLDYCERINSRCATKEEVLRVHTEDHYNMMKSLQSMDEQALAALTDEFDSLYLNSESFHSALLSAGSVIEGCVAVVEGRVKNAFAIVRPPGHHAEQDEPMGFCLFNNVAISIKYLRDHFPEIKRILVLDWDIHFGNGTQRLTNDDKDVLYVSLHRYESQGESNEVVYFYPEDKFGSADYCGSGTGIGRTVNIPWTCDGVHDGDYLYAFQQVVMPVALEFEPSFVIVSAGFDAAAGDHIGQCCVTPAGYSQMTHMLKSLAGGKLLLALEGGYNLEAIAKSSAACMAVLMGEPPATPGISQPSEKCIRTIENVKRIQAEHWKCFQ